MNDYESNDEEEGEDNDNEEYDEDSYDDEDYDDEDYDDEDYDDDYDDVEDHHDANDKVKEEQGITETYQAGDGDIELEYDNDTNKVGKVVVTTGNQSSKENIAALHNHDDSRKVDINAKQPAVTVTVTKPTTTSTTTSAPTYDCKCYSF